MSNNFKIGSLFDGSGGFPLAGSLCGIEPVWMSEVEPYPIAVTKSRFDGRADSPLLQVARKHFPEMKLISKHLGNICEINGAEVEPVDVITFGSPCQDLSVAGKRAGLKHEANGDEETTRSGLFMEAVRIIKEMREATHGKYPSFALWENVPGAFSSNKGEDFRIVLEELIKIVEPSCTVPAPDKNGWPYADCYLGAGWSLAYRVFDAQFWGVPQRRRRIHLVLDLRGERAGDVLFKSEGLSGYSAESFRSWQTTAGDAENCVGTADRERPVGLDIRVYESHPMDSRIKELGDDVAPTVSVKWHKGAADTPLVCAKEQYLFENHSQDTRYKGPLDVSPMLPAQLGTGGNNTPFVIEKEDPIYCIDGDKIGKAERSGGSGLGIRHGDVMYTLTAKDAGQHAVAYSIGNGQLNQISMSETCNTLDCMHDKQAILLGVKEITNAVRVRYIVRRLTPTECARLQGFADRWGDIDPKSDFSDEEYSFWLEVRNTHAAINGKAEKEYTKDQMLTWYNKLLTDSAEYKMWGNGIALPPALYCMQGIVEALQKGVA